MQLPFGKKDAPGKDGANDKKSTRSQKVPSDTSMRKKRGGSSKTAAADKSTGKRKHVVKKEKPTEPTGIFSAPAQIMGPRLVFIACVVILCLLGLVMIYSSSSIEAYGDSTFGNNPFYFFKQQVVWLAVGTAACVAAACIPYSVWKGAGWAYFLWGMTFALLTAVFAGLGTTSLGADRSLPLGPVSIQPAEFAKITLILLMASILERKSAGSISTVRANGEMAVTACLTLFMIYEQPDLGTAIILFVGIVCFLMLAGMNIKPIMVIIAVCVAYVIVVCFVQPYHLDRIKTMIDPWSDAQGNGYQSVQGFLAFGSGGIFGTGLGMSRQKYDYLPYAYNDFIYAVIGEELGLVGALFTLLVFAAFIYAGIRIAHTAKDVHGAVLAGSYTCMIGFQACVNMACVVGMAPVTGKALPFISYGGSSLMATMIMCGLILSVSIRSRLDNQVEKRRENLVVMDGGKVASRPGSATPQGSAATGALGGVFGSVAGAVGGAVGAVAEHLPGSSNAAAEQERGSRRNHRADGRANSGSATRRSESNHASGSGAGRARTQGASYGNNRISGASARQRSESSDAGHGYRRATNNRTTRVDYGSISSSASTAGGRSRSTQREQQPQTSRRARSRKGDIDLELVDIRPREGRRSRASQRDGAQSNNYRADGPRGGSGVRSGNGARGGNGSRGNNGRPRSSSASHGGTTRRR